jgi:alanine racemase
MNGVVTRREGVLLEIDETVIEANTRLIAAHVPVPVLGVVKSDGYGHGAVTVARAALAGGATSIGVTGLDDAARLRAAGITAPILSWMNPDGIDGETAAELHTALAVNSVEQLEAAGHSKSGVAVHLQLDTGMARDGAAESTWGAVVAKAAELDRRGDIHLIGVMSHLGFAETPGHPRTALALAAFARGLDLVRAAGMYPRYRHIAATSAALSDPSTRGNLVRIGAGLVGVDLSATLALHPAMRLRARLVEVREVRAGAQVGYGGSWTAERATRIGLIPVGYGDGLPRVPSGLASVTINGRRRRVVGAVSMNALLVDLGSAGGSDGQVGDLATILGDPAHGEPAAHDWARWAGTIPQDILTAIGRSGRRRTP